MAKTTKYAPKTYTVIVARFWSDRVFQMFLSFSWEDAQCQDDINNISACSAGSSENNVWGQFAGVTESEKSHVLEHSTALDVDP